MENNYIMTILLRSNVEKDDLFIELSELIEGKGFNLEGELRTTPIESTGASKSLYWEAFNKAIQKHVEDLSSLSF